MKYVLLSQKGPSVSKLCLGTGSFGTGLPKAAAFEQMDHFYEQGGTFLDTARVYAAWIPGGDQASEKTIGAWMKERKLRDKIVISTKGAHPDLKTMDVPRMGKNQVRKDLEESLAALGTDWIDLYFLHRDDPAVPAAEILGMLEEFRKEGKIRRYGCSNWKLERIEAADLEARRLGYEGFISNQLLWCIADLNVSGIGDKTLAVMDKETFAYHARTGKSAMAYMSACKGYFTKKRRGLPVAPDLEAMYGNPSNEAVLDGLPAWEAALRSSTASIVLAYIMAGPFPAVPIASFSSLAQLDEGLAASDISFSPDILEEIRRSRRFLFP
ncbi:MAG: aldo/keto reductase [Treponema sp.]|jgi:aryl-alcohol dehydrogenase-like predicted oxidoreductase|nr:aldo/keto reductase [Treponema sp.]